MPEFSGQKLPKTGAHPRLTHSEVPPPPGLSTDWSCPQTGGMTLAIFETKNALTA